MQIPVLIEPEVLVPAGSEIDALREVVCLCSQKRVLAAVRLVWADFGDGWGWRAVCSPSCYLAAFSEGHTS